MKYAPSLCITLIRWHRRHIQGLWCMLSDIYHVYFNYVRCVSLNAIKSFKFFVIIVERTQDLTQPSCSPPSGLHLFCTLARVPHLSGCRLSGRSRLLRENMTLAEHCLTLMEAGYLAYTIDLISWQVSAGVNTRWLIGFISWTADSGWTEWICSSVIK